MSDIGRCCWVKLGVVVGAIGLLDTVGCCWTLLVLLTVLKFAVDELFSHTIYAPTTGGATGENSDMGGSAITASMPFSAAEFSPIQSPSRAAPLLTEFELDFEDIGHIHLSLFWKRWRRIDGVDTPTLPVDGPFCAKTSRYGPFLAPKLAVMDHFGAQTSRFRRVAAHNMVGDAETN